MPLDQALNFNATITWVFHRWPQVSTGMVDGKLFGYRVPLVTGTAEDDVTGSLTYYFGPDKELRRITLKGDTGDAHKLVKWLSTQFGLVQQAADKRGVFVYRANRKNSTSELKVRPRAIMRSSDPHQRFEVALVLDRPATEKEADEPSRFSLFGNR
ncbi:MAG: hypothetical protein N2C12_08170, partial [Planctomycetales bacterium]